MPSSVTITSGQFRGRSLATPSGATHPMGSREKLALFNILTPYLSGAKVLDAFAGSGALGLEAISRGASEVVFIEKNRHAAQIIAQNIASLGISPKIAQIQPISVTAYVKNARKAPQNAPQRLFDLILADPPYDRFRPSEVENLAHLLAPDGILALSHPRVATSTPVFFNLTPITERHYAGATISLFRRSK